MRMVSPNIEARKKLLLETTNQNLRNNSSNRFNIQAKKFQAINQMTRTVSLLYMKPEVENYRNKFLKMKWNR